MQPQMKLGGLWSRSTQWGAEARVLIMLLRLRLMWENFYKQSNPNLNLSVVKNIKVDKEMYTCRIHVKISFLPIVRQLPRKGEP